jgi:hypothetical protein
MAFSVFFTRATHEAHVMPSTGMMTVVVPASFDAAYNDPWGLMSRSPRAVPIRATLRTNQTIALRLKMNALDTALLLPDAF